MDYKTIKEYASDTFIEKKSKFIGHIAPVKTQAEAMNFIGKISKQHSDAAHNVYAYILRDGQIEHCSDNGEPRGTAGVPVLEVLKKAELVDVCIVVTRYFGGILLGGGGLVRAYSHSAGLSVKKAQILHMTKCCLVCLKCAYQLYGKISYAFPSYNIRVEKSEFAEQVTINFVIRSDRLEAFSKEITEITNGQAEIKTISETLRAAD